MNYTQSDIECMQQYVSDYSFDELLSADVKVSPEDFIEFFMIGKLIAENMNDDDWEEYISLKTDEAVKDFIMEKSTENQIGDGSETFGRNALFVIDMGITSVAYDKGIFPIDEDDDWE